MAEPIRMFAGFEAQIFDYIAARQLVERQPALFDDITDRYAKENRGKASLILRTLQEEGVIELLDWREPREKNCLAYRLTEKGTESAKLLHKEYLQKILKE